MNRLLTAAAAFCALSLGPAGASACGGFFCSSSPIDQAGETIVYGLEEDGTLTMAIQIRYAGDDDDFAWILPVMAPPELSIGSDALFSELTRVTEPTFVTEFRTEGDCRDYPRCVSRTTCREPVSSGCGMAAPSGASDPWTGGFVDASAPPPVYDASGGASDAGAGGVMVFSEGAIGPYDSVVLGAATAREVVDWLHENDYQVPESSVPLLETYAAAGQVFVALRLRSNADTRQIQPIVLRMPTEEACLPIRLTAIATVPDMPITAFFLGREPVTPQNYSTVEIETDDLAFWQGGRRWRTEVSLAARAMGGQAFSRDYSGPTPAITLELPSVLDLAGQTDPAAFIRELQSRGYRGDDQLLRLFERFIVPPPGETPQAYYNCLAFGSTAGCGEPASFDPAALAARIDAELTQPRADAQALVNRHPRLTRLYTTMRAEDMTVDPVFITDPDLPDVDNVYTAARVTECSSDYYAGSAPEHWDLDGEIIPISSGSRADDSAYCRDLGLVLPSEVTDCPEMTSDSGGCLCMVGGAAPIQGGIVAGVFLIFAARRYRRR